MKKSLFLFLFFGVVIINCFSQQGPKWSVGGNAINSGEFLGTTNAADLIFKTNNSERFKIDANGNIVVQSFITNNSGIVFSDMNGVLNKLDYSGIATQYLAGDGSFRDIVSFTGWKIIRNDVVNINTGNIGIGILSAQYKLDVFGDARISNNLYVGGGIVIADKVQASSQVTTMSVVADSLSVSTNTSFAGDVKANNKLNVQGNATFMGSIGLGVTTPGEKLEVVGNTKISSNTSVGGDLILSNVTGSNGLAYIDSTGAFKIIAGTMSPHPGVPLPVIHVPEAWNII